MAIGEDNSSSNGRNRTYEPTYYSRVRLRGEDNKQLSITYRSGLMILEIGSVEENYKVNPLIAIHLSPMKANLLVAQIDAFLSYRDGNKIDPNKAFGVNAGMGEKITYIGFSTNKEKVITITIGKFDSSGVIVESQNINLTKDYNYSLEWNDLGSNDLTKVFDNNAEIILLRNGIADFGRHMIGSIAYSVHDINRFQNGHTEKRFDEIFDKLGIERRSYGGGNNRNFTQNNFLSNANSSSKSTTLEEVEDLLA